jgi:hemoglobin/transferrin/lactoferrin receptor protein
MKFYCIAVAILLCNVVYAQQKTPEIIIDTTKVVTTLDEVIISTSNFAEKKKNIVQAIDVVTAKKIASANAQNTGDLLMSTGKIFVQKSQQGGSSPVIRGFEASRILLIVDGVRMNNLIYRTGHLQNAISIDQNTLSRVEVMYGPSSTIYGSDALGGAIHFITKSPTLAFNKKSLFTGTAFARYSSANNEKSIHTDFSIANKKLGWFHAINFSDFDDVKMGSKYLSAYPNFGRRVSYIENINGIDSIVANKDDRVQKFSGYKQWDITEKLFYKQSENVRHSFNFQFSNTTNVPRYDRLQDTRNFGGTIGTTLRFADWYYGPQKRLLTAYELNINKLLFFDEVKANINYQALEESRITREYRQYDKLDTRVENVSVFGTTISGKKTFGKNEIVTGIDMQLGKVRSTATRTNTITNVITKLDSRYPDGKNEMNNLGIFAQHTYKHRNGKLVFNEGVRLQLTFLQSIVIDNSFFNLPITTVKQNNIAVTGNAGFVYSASKNTTVRFGLASGFRAPNIDDLTKIFESSTASRQVVLPNANLKPEFTYNADFAVAQKIGKVVSVEFNGYYTMFSNAIIKAPFTFNGQDSILYNGIKSQVLASQNVNRANVFGFSFSADATLKNGFSIASTISYTKGFYITDASKASRIFEKQASGKYILVSKNVSSKPLDHIPPVIGKTSFSYAYKKINTSLFFMYNGWKKLDKYNADGEDNEQYATAEGMPAWITTNWNGSYSFTKNMQLQIAVENILDRNYRNFASGFSAAGRNFIVALRGNF